MKEKMREKGDLAREGDQNKTENRSTNLALPPEAHALESTRQPRPLRHTPRHGRLRRSSRVRPLRARRVHRPRCPTPVSLPLQHLPIERRPRSSTQTSSREQVLQPLDALPPSQPTPAGEVVGLFLRRRRTPTLTSSFDGGGGEENFVGGTRSGRRSSELDGGSDAFEVFERLESEERGFVERGGSGSGRVRGGRRGGGSVVRETFERGPPGESRFRSALSSLPLST